MNEPVYRNAQASAIDDLNELLPRLQKLNEQATALKLIVRGTGLILGNYDEIDDKYKFQAKVSYPNQSQQKHRR